MSKKYDLDRFVPAQERDYETALAEIRAGRKRSHWIWYIFPQPKGLGYSFNAQYYGIEDIEEARQYLAHPVLGGRLIEITTALTELEENDPGKIMPGIDALKLRSCMTLFAVISEEGSVFQKVLDKYYGGLRDERTSELLGSGN